MIKTKRIARYLISFIAAGLLFSLFLSGCGLTTTPTPEPVSLNFSYPEIDHAFYTSLVPVFNQQYPSIRVELNPVSGDGLYGIDPGESDLMAASVFYLRELQASSGILGLNAAIQGDDSFNMSDYLQGTVDFLSVEGETWAIPVGIDIDVMYFNKDLFDQKNVPYPDTGWDWDDFLGYALSIHEPEGDKDRIFGYTTISSHQDVYSLIYQHGGTLFDDVQNPTEPTFNDPATVEAVEFFADLIHSYNVAPTPAQARSQFGSNRYAFENGILNGSIAMWSSPLSQRGGYSEGFKWLFNWGVAVLPRDVFAFTPSWVEDGYAISAETNHPDECWALLNFFSGQINPRLVPPRRSLVESSTYQDLVGEEISNVVRESLEYAVPVSLWQWVSLGSAIQIFNHAIEEVVDGSATPQEALDYAQGRVMDQKP